MNKPKKIKLEVELSEQEAWDLAQFCKRLYFNDVASCAVDVEEAHRMQFAMCKIQDGLDLVGISPR